MTIRYHIQAKETNAKEPGMKILYCDICKKPVENPSSGINYFHIADIDICEPCSDGWYDDFTLRILRESMQKGKISVPKR
jgi:hypothetical protein